MMERATNINDYLNTQGDLHQHLIFLFYDSCL